MTGAFISWSGGKDSCLAAYLAHQSGLEIRWLLNIADERGIISRSHKLPVGLLKLQAKAMGLPILIQPARDDNYEQNFLKSISILREQGITTGVFGDVDIIQHREWVECVCQKGGITPYLPLWGRNQLEILNDFISAGFEAIIVVTRAEVLDDKWLGRRVDSQLINDLRRLSSHKPITLCGEMGEYHTLVTDAPLFRSKILVETMEKVQHDGYWILNINKYSLLGK